MQEITQLSSLECLCEATALAVIKKIMIAELCVSDGALRPAVNNGEPNDNLSTEAFTSQTAAILTAHQPSNLPTNRLRRWKETAEPELTSDERVLGDRDPVTAWTDVPDGRRRLLYKKLSKIGEYFEIDIRSSRKTSKKAAHFRREGLLVTYGFPRRSLLFE